MSEAVASIAMVRVTAARAFRRAGIGFAAGVTELDLLDLTATQIIAIANEPALVMEGRLFGDDEWQVFPAPVAADLPMLEAELEVAKGKAAEMRLALEAGRPDDDTDLDTKGEPAPTPPPAPTPAPEAATAAEVQAPAQAAGKADKPTK